MNNLNLVQRVKELRNRKGILAEESNLIIRSIQKTDNDGTKIKEALLFFVLILSLLASGQNKEKTKIYQTRKFYPEVKQRSVIIGQIKNINEFPDAPRAIELSVKDITISHQHSFETKIDNNGKFIFDIPLYHSINSYLNYGDARITPYLFPNDTIYVNCKIDKKGFKIGIVSGEFDVKHDKFETEFFKQHRWIHYNQINKFRNKLSKDSAPQELKNQYLEFEKRLLEKIEVKIIKDSLNKTLADYLKYSAKYSIYRDIIRLGKKIENNNEKQEFFSFLTDSIVFNKKAMVTSDYQSFLNAYLFYVEPRKNLSVVNTNKTKAQAKMELITKSMSHSFDVRSGVWAEFLTASKIYGQVFRKEEELTVEMIDFLTKKIKENFKEPYVKQLLLAMCNKTNKKIEKTNTLEIPTETKLKQYSALTGEQFWSKIIEENKGKVIYIDVWATWCTPCKTQIPHSLRMHNMLKNKNISFVYLCCSSKEETWINVIKKYQMKGIQILLNDKQYEYIKTKFSISGIPRYILIDKTGNIINPDAPKPDSEQIMEDLKNLTD